MEGASVRQFKIVCVFCGTSLGKGEEFVKAADNLGRVLAERKLHLVYRGGSLRLMGCVSTAAHVGGSEVVGIIPKALSTGNITGKTVGGELIVLTMHERIAKMLDFAYAFIALPGGFGTLEEIFQIASWAQLTIHQKPIGLLNVNGFFNKLLSFLDHAVEQNFISQTTGKLLISASTADELINQLQNFVHEPDPTMARLEWSTESSKKRKLDLSLRL